MHKVVVDTNIWIRILLGGRMSLPVLSAWQDDKFILVTSQELLDEFQEVWQRPRLAKRIKSNQANRLFRQMSLRGEVVKLKTIPPKCRDPKDHPVLATAIDGQATAIVSGDDDLRADEELRKAMLNYGIQIMGVRSLFDLLDNDSQKADLTKNE